MCICTLKIKQTLRNSLFMIYAVFTLVFDSNFPVFDFVYIIEGSKNKSLIHFFMLLLHEAHIYVCILNHGLISHIYRQMYKLSVTFKFLQGYIMCIKCYR